MKKIIQSIAVAFVLSFVSTVHATVTVGHIQNAGAGQFFDVNGAALPAGAVSIGFFSVPAPSDSAFGTTIRDWTSLLAAGYIDVRSTAGTSLSTGFDWNFPLPVGGSVLGISFSTLPLNTQLYVVAFNLGTYNLLTPGDSFQGATQWSVVKDTTNLSPPDLGTRNIVLSTVTAPEVLVGTDNGVNVNLAIPEPSSMILIGTGIIGLLGRRRRNAGGRKSLTASRQS